MSYNRLDVVKYDFAAFDFGAAGGDLTQGIKPPAGYERGRILDVGVEQITEAFAGTTKDAQVRVGTSSGDATYCLLNVPSGTAIGDVANTRDDTNAIVEPGIVVSDLTGDQLEVTLDEATGTPTGQASSYVIIGWF